MTGELGSGGRVSCGKRVNRLRKGEVEGTGRQEDRKGGLRASQPNRKAPTGGWCRPLSGASNIGMQVELMQKISTQNGMGNIGYYKDERERVGKPRSNEINFCPKVRMDEWFIACRGRER